MDRPLEESSWLLACGCLLQPEDVLCYYLLLACVGGDVVIDGRRCCYHASRLDDDNVGAEAGGREYGVCRGDKERKARQRVAATGQGQGAPQSMYAASEWRTLRLHPRCTPAQGGFFLHPDDSYQVLLSLIVTIIAAMPCPCPSRHPESRAACFSQVSNSNAAYI